MGGGGVHKGGISNMDIIDYQHLKQYCGCKTKLQDNYPFDEFMLGIDGIYHTIGDDSYFINAKNIISQEHILITGRTYLLQNNHSKGFTIVKFLEAFYDNGYVHLIVQNIINNNCLMSIKCPVPSNKNECTWEILDIDFLLKTVSSTNRLKSDKKSRINTDSELLEFDY